MSNPLRSSASTGFNPSPQLTASDQQKQIGRRVQLSKMGNSSRDFKENSPNLSACINPNKIHPQMMKKNTLENHKFSQLSNNQSPKKVFQPPSKPSRTPLGTGNKPRLSRSQSKRNMFPPKTTNRKKELRRKSNAVKNIKNAILKSPFKKEWTESKLNLAAKKIVEHKQNNQKKIAAKKDIYTDKKLRKKARDEIKNLDAESVKKVKRMFSEMMSPIGCILLLLEKMKNNPELAKNLNRHIDLLEEIGEKKETFKFFFDRLAYVAKRDAKKAFNDYKKTQE